MTNQSIANVVVALLKEVEMDGEMMEHIINQVGMRDQMVKQLTPQDDIVELERGKDLIVASFTRNALIEYTRTIQERFKTAAFEAIANAGIDYEGLVELELGWDNKISIEVNESDLANEIESAIDDGFEMDDESIFDEACNVIAHMKVV